ncbi:hypothetical protein CC86DRAFT_383839 [Ophiobolus disseminans]|uniref:Uncharacterized protein n=1 Tax=Ophiobolus disseminans TaxID=1469910 RepID=A0A6A6ZUM1_9PLEO|nr:hypothetical protein CC86DRAFT_383839 [Ophiobolus disseminans]
MAQPPTPKELLKIILEACAEFGNGDLRKVFNFLGTSTSPATRSSTSSGRTPTSRYSSATGRKRKILLHDITAACYNYVFCPHNNVDIDSPMPCSRTFLLRRASLEEAPTSGLFDNNSPLLLLFMVLQELQTDPNLKNVDVVLKDDLDTVAAWLLQDLEKAHHRSTGYLEAFEGLQGQLRGIWDSSRVSYYEDGQKGGSYYAVRPSSSTSLNNQPSSSSLLYSHICDRRKPVALLHGWGQEEGSGKRWINGE